MVRISVCHCQAYTTTLCSLKQMLPLRLESASVRHTQLWDLSLSGLQKRGEEAEDKHFIKEMAGSSHILQHHTSFRTAAEVPGLIPHRHHLAGLAISYTARTSQSLELPVDQCYRCLAEGCRLEPEEGARSCTLTLQSLLSMAKKSALVGCSCLLAQSYA